MNFKELIPDYSGNINDLQINSISINSQEITSGDLYISLAKNITNQKKYNLDALPNWAW